MPDPVFLSVEEALAKLDVLALGPAEGDDLGGTTRKRELSGRGREDPLHAGQRKAEKPDEVTEERRVQLALGVIDGDDALTLAGRIGPGIPGEERA